MVQAVDTSCALVQVHVVDDVDDSRHSETLGRHVEQEEDRIVETFGNCMFTNLNIID